MYSASQAIRDGHALGTVSFDSCSDVCQNRPVRILPRCAASAGPLPSPSPESCRQLRAPSAPMEIDFALTTAAPWSPGRRAGARVLPVLGLKGDDATPPGIRAGSKPALALLTSAFMAVAGAALHLARGQRSAPNPSAEQTRNAALRSRARTSGAVSSSSPPGLQFPEIGSTSRSLRPDRPTAPG